MMATSQALPYQADRANEQNMLFRVYLGIQVVVCIGLLFGLGFLYLNHFAPEWMLLDINIDHSGYENLVDNLVFGEVSISAVITIAQLAFVIGLVYRRTWGYAGLLVIMSLVALNMLVSFNSIIAFVLACVGMAALWLIVNYTDVYLE